MKRREYGRFLVDLCNKKCVSMNDIISIKRILDVQDMLKVMELVCKKDEMPKLFLKKADKHSEILLNRFAHIFSGQLRDDIIKKEIMCELKFLTVQVGIGCSEIKAFIEKRQEYEVLFMRGAYEEALEKIENFEKEYGLSFWSTDCKINTLSLLDQTKTDEFCAQVIEEASSASVKAYINISRYRFLKDVTGIYFKSLLENILNEYEDEEQESNFKEGFKCYINSNVDICRGFDLFRIRHLLLVSDRLTLIDKYILLEKIFSWLCSESVYEENGFIDGVLDCAKLLKVKIGSSLWENITILLSDDIDITIKKEKIVINNCLEKFCIGENEECYNMCFRELKVYSNCFSLINLMAKSGMCESRSVPYLELAWFIRKLYLKEDVNTEFVGVIELCDVYERIYSHFSFGNNLGVIIENETSPIMLQGKMSYINALINSNYIPSKLAFFLKGQKQIKFIQEYKKKIGKLFFCDWQIATYSEADEVIFSNYCYDIISAELKSIKQMDISVLEDYKLVNCDDLRSNMCKSFALKKQFEWAVDNNEWLKAVEIYVKSFFVSQWMVIKFDYNKINDKMTRQLKKYLENSMSYCIYAYITRFELYKGENISETVVNSCRKIINKNENKSVLDIDIPDNGVEQQKIIFFLRNICTYDSLRRVKLGVSLVQEIYSERLQIIEKIIPYYNMVGKKEDVNALNKEKAEISSKIEYLDIAKCINKGKINTSWVVFSEEAESAIMSIYNMYNNMIENITLPSYVDAFAIVKKDYVQEINRILSITIRHGILEGELVRFLRKCKISIDLKDISHKNKKLIESFYQKIYRLLEDLLNNYIMATYKYEKETKLLLYVDEELLQKSFDELPQNMSGPEDIRDIYRKILDEELENKLSEWGDKICVHIDREIRKYLGELHEACCDDLKDDVNKTCDLLGEEIEKLKAWFRITENQDVSYRLVTLGDMLEQEWGSVRVSVNLSEDLLVTGNTINFLYTIIRELIWNAEKYSGYNEEEPDFFIIIAVDENAGKIVFQVKNNVSNDVSRESVCNNIKEIEEIIQTVEKADVTIFSRKDIYEGKSGYKKIVKLLKRNYDGKYKINVEYVESEFVVVIEFLLEALV